MWQSWLTNLSSRCLSSSTKSGKWWQSGASQACTRPKMPVRSFCSSSSTLKKTTAIRATTRNCRPSSTPRRTWRLRSLRLESLLRSILILRETACAISGSENNLPSSKRLHSNRQTYQTSKTRLKPCSASTTKAPSSTRPNSRTSLALSNESTLSSTPSESSSRSTQITCSRRGLETTLKAIGKITVTCRTVISRGVRAKTTSGLRQPNQPIDPSISTSVQLFPRRRVGKVDPKLS